MSERRLGGPFFFVVCTAGGERKAPQNPKQVFIMIFWVLGTLAFEAPSLKKKKKISAFSLGLEASYPQTSPGLTLEGEQPDWRRIQVLLPDPSFSAFTSTHVTYHNRISSATDRDPRGAEFWNTFYIFAFYFSGNLRSILYQRFF